MISAELMYEKVMHRMDMTKETKEEELQEIIRTVLEDESKKEFIPLSEKIRLSRELVICAVKEKRNSEFNSVMRYRQWERH